jgi:hypothetical protein
MEVAILGLACPLFSRSTIEAPILSVPGTRLLELFRHHSQVPSVLPVSKKKLRRLGLTNLQII